MTSSNRQWTGRFPTAAKAALREGKKLDAIKIFRLETGAGLAEAKEAVERYAADPALWDEAAVEEPAPGEPAGSTGGNGTGDRSAATVSSVAENELFHGRLIQAIRIVREENRIGLKDAKEIVDRYVADHPALRLQLERIRADARRVWLTRLLVILGLAALIATLFVWR